MNSQGLGSTLWLCHVQSETQQVPEGGNTAWAGATLLCSQQTQTQTNICPVIYMCVFNFNVYFHIHKIHVFFFLNLEGIKTELSHLVGHTLNACIA